jgi:hypothetical protein
VVQAVDQGLPYKSSEPGRNAALVGGRGQRAVGLPLWRHNPLIPVWAWSLHQPLTWMDGYPGQSSGHWRDETTQPHNSTQLGKQLLGGWSQEGVLSTSGRLKPELDPTAALQSSLLGHCSFSPYSTLLL